MATCDNKQQEGKRVIGCLDASRADVTNEEAMLTANPMIFQSTLQHPDSNEAS